VRSIIKNRANSEHGVSNKSPIAVRSLPIGKKVPLPV